MCIKFEKISTWKIEIPQWSPASCSLHKNIPLGTIHKWYQPLRIEGVVPKGDVTPKAFLVKWVTRGRERSKISKNEWRHIFIDDPLPFKVLECMFVGKTLGKVLNGTLIHKIFLSISFANFLCLLWVGQKIYTLMSSTYKKITQMANEYKTQKEILYSWY